MTFDLFDYVDARNINQFAKWTKDLEVTSRAKLNARIDMLQMHGDTIFPDILAGTSVPGILKLKCKGNVQLRPLLCRGPTNPLNEYTFLMGAVERDGKFHPRDAPVTADAIRATVAGTPKRRIEHERIS